MGARARNEADESNLPSLPAGGLGLLLPGYAHWAWRRPEPALIYFGSFATAMLVGAFAWGTGTGLALLTFAFIAHVASAADALRLATFPGFGRLTPVATASAGLGVGVYAPLFATASLLAWPGVNAEGARSEGYLINRLAYRHGVKSPEPGERVWLRDAVGPPIASIAATEGQEVDWRNGSLSIDGRLIPLAPFKLGSVPETARFNIPKAHLLVLYERLEPNSPIWEIVPANRVVGKAWAKTYPLTDRRLLQ